MRSSHVIELLSVVFYAATALTATSNSASDSIILLPSVPPPTTTRDPWQCATENITDYFNVPTATGALNSALNSYGKALFASCTLTGRDITACPVPDTTAWCQFSTAAPSTVLSDYASYGSVVSSWWANHHSGALSLAENCPYGWYRAAQRNLFGFSALNQTIIFAGCYAEAQATAGVSTSSSPTGPTATPGSKPAVSRASPTSTPVSPSTTSSRSSSATSNGANSLPTTQSSSAATNTAYNRAWAAALGIWTVAFSVIVLR